MSLCSSVFSLQIPAASRISLTPQVQQSPLEQYLSELGAMSNEDRARTLLALAALADQGQPDQSERAQERESSDALPGWFQVTLDLETFPRFK